MPWICERTGFGSRRKNAVALEPITHIEMLAPLACQSRMAISAALKVVALSEPHSPRSDEITMMPTFFTSAAFLAGTGCDSRDWPA